MCECVLKHCGSGTFKCILKPLINNKWIKKRLERRSKQAWVVTRFVCQHHKLHYCFIYFFVFEIALNSLSHCCYVWSHLPKSPKPVRCWLIFSKQHSSTTSPTQTLEHVSTSQVFMTFSTQEASCVFFFYNLQTASNNSSTPRSDTEDVKVVCHSSTTEHLACTNNTSALGFKRMTYFFLPGRRACCQSLLSVDFVQF